MIIFNIHPPIVCPGETIRISFNYLPHLKFKKKNWNKNYLKYLLSLK
jgi:hypothetical protein